MKRVMSFLTALFLAGGFLMPVAVVAGVAGQFKDQAFENTDDTGSMTVSNYGRAQTFKPTANKIVSVNLYLTDMLPDKRLNVTIKKESDGSTVSPATASVPFTGQIKDGWVTIAYESPYVAVTPETEYGIYATITGDTQTKWSWKSGNPYARGQAKGFADDDFLFSVWGIKDAVTTTEAKTTAAIVVDDSIKSPVLVTAEKLGKEVDLSTKKEVSLASKDKLVLKGTSFKGAGVILTIDGKEYTASVAPDGNWDYTVDAFTLKEGTYNIQGQSHKDGKGSEKADLLEVKILGAKTITVATDKSWFAGWNIFYVLIPVGMLLLLLLLLALIARRHHNEKMGGNSGEEEKETTVVSEAAEEQVVEEPKIIKGKKSKNK